jgi:hypothetical protein
MRFKFLGYAKPMLLRCYADERRRRFCQHENATLRLTPAVMRPFCRGFDTLSCMDHIPEGRIARSKQKGRAVHRKRDRLPRWKRFAGAGLIAFGSQLCPWIGPAVAGEPSLHSVRTHTQRETKDADIGRDTGDAKHFAERVKRHQRRHFTKQRREFRKAQQRLESQRRLRKAKIKARQFAAARRRATQHAPRRKQTHAPPNTATTQERRGLNPVGNLTDGL